MTPLNWWQATRNALCESIEPTMILSEKSTDFSEANSRNHITFIDAKWAVHMHSVL